MNVQFNTIQDKIKYALRDYTSVGRQSPLSFSFLTDEQVYQMHPERYSFYMQMLDALQDPNTGLLDRVLSIENKSRYARDQLQRTSKDVAKALRYLTLNLDTNKKVVTGGSFSPRNDAIDMLNVFYRTEKARYKYSDEHDVSHQGLITALLNIDEKEFYETIPSLTDPFTASKEYTVPKWGDFDSFKYVTAIFKIVLNSDNIADNLKDVYFNVYIKNYLIDFILKKFNLDNIDVEHYKSDLDKFDANDLKEVKKCLSDPTQNHYNSKEPFYKCIQSLAHSTTKETDLFKLAKGESAKLKGDPSPIVSVPVGSTPSGPTAPVPAGPLPAAAPVDPPTTPDPAPVVPAPAPIPVVVPPADPAPAPVVPTPAPVVPTPAPVVPAPAPVVPAPVVVPPADPVSAPITKDTPLDPSAEILINSLNTLIDSSAAPVRLHVSKGGSYYTDMLDEVEKNKGNPEAVEKLADQLDTHPIFNPENEKISMTDRVIFIAVTFMIRGLTLFLIDWGINSMLITTFNRAFLYYTLLYFTLFMMWVLLVNAGSDGENIPLKMAFYYVNWKANRVGRILAHLAVQVFLIPIPFIVREPLQGAPDTATFEKRRAVYRVLSNFTFFVWVMTSIIALRF